MSTPAVPIKLDSLTANNLGIFNRIVAPAEYPDHYVQQCRDSGELCRYAYFGEVPVGVIVLQTVVNKSPVALNIALLRVLDAYAGSFHVEAELVQYALALCPKRHVAACTAVVKRSDTGLVRLLTDMGFLPLTGPVPDSYRTLSVDAASGEILFVKTV